ncbi:MAG: helix-turn-helix transcriptional regulator [Pseudomonadota bacterium]
MIDPNHRPLIVTRFYALGEAGPNLGISAFDLLRLGAAGDLNLCVPLPANTRAYTIDPHSTATRDSRAWLEKRLHRARPTRKGVPVLQNDNIVALRMSPAQCREVAAFGFTRTSEFLFAYVVNYTYAFGYSDPMEIPPLRMPLFKPDGTATPQHQWRFAIYPTDVQFKFNVQSGYAAPQELRISLEDIRVLGRELGRLPKTIDVAPTSESVSAHNEADGTDNAPSTTPEKPVRRKKRRVQKAADPKESPATPEPSPETTEKESIVFLRLDEVIRRTKLSKTTIYDYLNPKHRLYDPTFPTPISIGSRAVGWIESEIDAWMQAQVGKSRKR